MKVVTAIYLYIYSQTGLDTDEYISYKNLQMGLENCNNIGKTRTKTKQKKRKIVHLRVGVMLGWGLKTVHNF